LKRKDYGKKEEIWRDFLCIDPYDWRELSANVTPIL
jgi:hypothetical protein